MSSSTYITTYLIPFNLKVTITYSIQLKIVLLIDVVYITWYKYNSSSLRVNLCPFCIQWVLATKRQHACRSHASSTSSTQVSWIMKSSPSRKELVNNNPHLALYVLSHIHTEESPMKPLKSMSLSYWNANSITHFRFLLEDFYRLYIGFPWCSNCVPGVL